MMPWKRISAELAAGRRAALVTIASVKGSSPREAGTRMVVTEAGYSGTIGGGAMEWQAIAEAQRLIAAAPAGAGGIHTFALGPELGQCCGGRVTLLIEAFTTDDGGWIAPLAKTEAAGGDSFLTEGRADSRGVYRRQRIECAEPGLGPGEACRLAAGRLLERHGDDCSPLMLFGAGHVGRALVLALAPLPFAVRWVDTRPEAFPVHLPANVLPVATSAPLDEIAAASPGSFVLVMTHSHALDLALAEAALRREDFPLVGVIGSRTKAARFRSRLRAGGIGEAMIDRFACPIGDIDLGSKAPAVIAAGLAVDLLRRRAQRRSLPAEVSPCTRTVHAAQ